MVKVILYAAVSIDGFIATKDRNSDWVSDLDNKTFISEIKKAGCLVVGRLTFEQFKDEIYPIEGVTNIVITNSKPTEANDENVHYAIGPRECIEIASQKGLKEIIVVGGAITNASFLKHGFIDEIIIDVHPLVLGDGLSIFNGIDKDANLELLESKTIENKLVLLRYKVVK